VSAGFWPSPAANASYDVRFWKSAEVSAYAPRTSLRASAAPNSCSVAAGPSGLCAQASAHTALSATAAAA